MTETAAGFCAQVAGFGERVAFHDAHGATSYAELDRRSRRIAQALLAANICKGARVGLLAPNDANWAAAFLGVLRVGAVAVPISTLSAPAELRTIIRHADLSLLLTAERYHKLDFPARLAEAFPEIVDARPSFALPAAPYLRQVWLSSEAGPAWTRPLAAALDDGDRPHWEAVRIAAEAALAPADPAFIIYTSGSTAAPKAVIHGHGPLVRQTASMAALRRLTDEDRILGLMPFFWVGGLAFDLMPGLHVGATFFCPTEREPGALLGLIAAERVTRVQADSSRIAALLAEPALDQLDLSCVKDGLFGIATGFSALGMSETLGPHSGEPFGSARPAHVPDSFGRPLPGIERRCVDPETGRDTPAGEFGELWLRGPMLMLGYHRIERADAFTAEGWFRTGDRVAILDDGHMRFAGRLSAMIKTAGANVAPAEVEAALYAHAGVLACSVFPLPDPVRGEAVAAVILAHPGQAVDQAVLRSALASRLASYKQPRFLAVLDYDEQWLTASGKFQRAKAVQHARSIWDESGSAQA